MTEGAHSPLDARVLPLTFSGLPGSRGENKALHACICKRAEKQSTVDHLQADLPRSATYMIVPAAHRCTSMCNCHDVRAWVQVRSFYQGMEAIMGLRLQQAAARAGGATSRDSRPSQTADTVISEL